MNLFFRLILVLGILLPTFLFADQITPVTPDNASIRFKGTARPVIVGKGRFTQFKGQLVWDDKMQELKSLSGTIDSQSLNTKNKTRDKHLKRKSMLNVKMFPTLSFKSTAVTRSGDTYHVTGLFTMRGKTQEINFDLNRHEMDGKDMLEGHVSLDRFAFGLKGYKYQIRKKIKGLFKIDLTPSTSPSL